VVAVFPILGQTATAAKPTDGAFDNPAFRQNDKSFGLIATLDDFGHQARHDVRQTVLEDRPRVGAVGKQLLQERKLSEQRGEDDEASVAILNISGCDQRVKQKAQRIDENMTLLAFDQLAPIKPMGIDTGPPFSALFTLWLSRMQAVGLASRSARSLHLTYSAW
jgi:hypothetical protein